MKARQGFAGLVVMLLIAAALVFSVAKVIAQTPRFTLEPATLPAQSGGVISIYASESAGVTFTLSTTVRMVGQGILATQYVSERALQATVPAGWPAGTYTLVALQTSAGEQELGTVRLTAPPTPTPQPKPEEPPAPGQPLLTIRNYTIDPPQVRPGQEFTVSIEVYNNGSRAAENTMVIFPGGTFLPVGQSGHMIGQVHINATFVASQRMRVPAGVSNGVQTLQVALSANDWSGAHFEFPQTLSVEVIGAPEGGAAPSGRPEVLIEDVSTTPSVIAPGTSFTLTLRLVNRGNRSATNVKATADPAMVIPSRGGGTATVDLIRVNQAVTVTLPLMLHTAKEGGRVGLAVALGYGDFEGGGYSGSQTIGIDVDTSLANRPQLLIDGYKTEPAEISPGDHFTLTLELLNVGGGAAQRLTLALGGEEGEQLGAFVPVDGSNVSFVSHIDAGGRELVSIRLMVAGNAETRPHNLPVALAYDTGGGTREKGTQRISLLIRRRPAFRVSFYRPVEGSAMAGQPFPLPIEVVNTSSYRFNVTQLEAAGEGLEFFGESSTSVGPLEPGSSWTLDAMAMAYEPGPVEVLVNIYYIDDLNQTQTISETLTVEVMEGFEPGPGPDGPFEPGGPEAPPLTFWQQILRFIRALFGLGS